MTRTELHSILRDITSRHVAVIGDFCLDSYWFFDPSREEYSLETGLLTQAVKSQRYSLGGAGNVCVNLRAMGVGRVSAFGVIGPDPFGRHMLGLLGMNGVECRGVVTQQTDWSTHVYCKPHLQDAEQRRIDFGNFNRLLDESAEELVGNLKSVIKQVDVVIINEQVESGIHSSARFQALLSAWIMENTGAMFVLDSRHCSDRYGSVVRKVNDHEAARLCGIQRAPDEHVLHNEAVQAGNFLFHRWKKPVFITRGARGCLVFDGAGLQEVPGLQILKRTDPVGAGDSTLAGIAATLATGRSPLTAAKVGNIVAAVTVQKLFQTGTASPDEILRIGTDPDYVYRPELAEDRRQARHHEATEIEIVTALPSSANFTHAILDHDGTISTLRQGWEEIMEPMMVHSVLGDRFATADEALYYRVRDRVRDFINKTTGIQTITQMEGLVDLVREFRCVPEEAIMTAAGYKQRFTDELAQLVTARLAKLQRQELDADDYTIKGARQFLKALAGAGIRLYLASGTDEADVQAEARALGYADLFEGRIYGSIGRPDRDAKKVVLERILREVGTAAATSLLAIGDGPVEIRETHKAGGFTVGVASDDIRRFGLSPGKRTRLVQAGADVIIPDYTQMSTLLHLLGIPV
jgi:sugar/nucleoside kinase (ribokinase family)/phosphoglycolate phosphatase-like HAD superfamily hydrolase